MRTIARFDRPPRMQCPVCHTTELFSPRPGHIVCRNCYSTAQFVTDGYGRAPKRLRPRYALAPRARTRERRTRMQGLVNVACG